MFFKLVPVVGFSSSYSYHEGKSAAKLQKLFEKKIISFFFDYFK